jgi:hypothetical protein
MPIPKQTENSGANRSIVLFRQWLWENASIEERKRIPFMRIFRLEVPEDPALSVRFEGRDLGFDVASNIALHIIIPVGDVVLVSAGTDVGRAWKGPVVSGTDAISIECWCAISLGCCPFSDNNPFVGSRCITGCVVTNQLSVLPVFHGYKIIGEDLVLVVINND